MAIKRARYRPKGSGNYGDIVHFETDSKMVKHGTSETVEDILDDYKSHKAETAAQDQAGHIKLSDVEAIAFIYAFTFERLL